MAEKGLELKITADAKNAKAGIDGTRAAVDELGKSAQAAGETAHTAAGKVGEIGEQPGVGGARAAIDELGKSAQAAGASAQATAGKVGGIGAQAGAINGAEAATGRFAKTTDWLNQKWQQTAGTIRDFAIGNVLAQAFMGLTRRATELAQAFIATNNQIVGLRRAFSAIYKDAALAEQQIAFLRKTSNDAGVGFEGLSNSFKSFTAAASAANIPLAVQNDLFSSVAKAGATLGLSTAETSRAVLALSQMASKGTVSMEELRQQLGESLPGALSLAARGLGLTEAELIKLVESGGLAARDLFPALAQSLKSMAGENDTLTGAWERFRNAIAQVFTAIGDGGGMQVLVTAMRALAGAVGVVLVPLQGFTETLFGMGRAIGAGAAAIALLTDTSTTWAQKAAALKDIGSDLGDSMAAAGGRIRATAGAFAEVALGADKSAASLGGAKGAAEQSTAAAAQLSQSWVSIGQAMSKAAADWSLQTAAAVKNAQAVKDQGAALVELARVEGNHGAILQAEQRAAADNAAALDAVARSRANELEIARAELTAKRNLIAGNAEEQKAREQDIKSLGDKVTALTAEAAAASQSAEAAKNAALARQAAADAEQDHSGQLAELTRHLVDERTALEGVRAEYDAGRATREQVADAERAVALAASNVRDAYIDQVDAARAAAITRKAESDSTISLLQTQKRLAGQSEEMARLMGNEEAARRFRIQQLEIDIRITQAKAEAMRAEAQGSIAVAQATLEELRVKGELTQVKQAELQASIQVAEAKLKEADAIRQSAGVTQQAINNMREFGDAAGRAGRAGGRAGDQVAGSWKGAAGAIRDASAAQSDFQRAQDRKYGRAGQSESLGTQKSGDLSPTMLGNTWQSIYNLAKGMGASEEDARRIAGSMFDSRGKYVGQAQQRFGESATAAAARMAGEAVRFAPPKTDQTGQSGRPGAGAGAASYVSNITIPGLGTTSASFADQASQNNVTNLLKRLAADKQRAI